MPKTIINEAIYQKAKNGLIQLQSQGTAANKLKAIMALLMALLMASL
jgi:hypothetical protein